MPPQDAAVVLGPLVHELSPLVDSTPHPLAHVHNEGTLPHRGIRDASIVAEKQLPLMRDAALAWRAGAGEAYLAMAQRYLDAWIATYEPNLDPIDETRFDALIETYAILAPKMETAPKAAARTFLRRWAAGYVAAIDAHATAHRAAKVGTWNNNWQSHRIKLVTMIAVALQDPALFDEARRLFRAQIDDNMKPDGEVIDFRERDALHYVIYDLEPLARAALAARVEGEDWFHYRGAESQSLARSLTWLIPYATGEKAHEEFRHSKVPFDAARAAAGEKGYSGPFEPATAADLLWTAGLFDPTYLGIARGLKREPPADLAMCGT